MQAIVDMIPIEDPQARTALIITSVLILLSFLLHLFQLWRLSHLNRKYKQLLGGLSGGKTLEEILLTHLDNVQMAVDRVRNLEVDCRKMEQDLKLCVQNVGVVRFNAFPDTGSDLSFAVALLDQGGDGVVVSSLYGRSEFRVYAKPIQKGVSTYHLTGEERLAIERAMAKNQ